MKIKNILYLAILFNSLCLRSTLLGSNVNGFTRTQLSKAGVHDDIITTLNIHNNKKYNVLDLDKTFPALGVCPGFMKALEDVKKTPYNSNLLAQNKSCYIKDSFFLELIATYVGTVEEANRLKNLANIKAEEEIKEDIKNRGAIDRIRAMWREAGFFFNKKRIAYVGVLISVVTAFYYLAKHGMPYLFRPTAPIIINEEHVPKKFYERFLPDFINKKKRSKSRYNDMIYPKKVMELLKKEIEYDKKIVREKNKKGKNKNLMFSNTALVGLSGVGKTLIFKIWAKEAKAYYLIIKGPTWAQMEPKDALKSLYELIAYVNSFKRPIFVFIDEADSVFPNRSGSSELSNKLVSAFLASNEKSFNSNVKFVFATNYFEKLDPAIRNRINKVIHIPLPDADTCYRILDHYLDKEVKKFKVEFGYDFYDKEAELGKLLLGLSGREIEGIVKEVVQRCYLDKTALDFELLEQSIQLRKESKRDLL